MDQVLKQAYNARLRQENALDRRQQLEIEQQLRLEMLQHKLQLEMLQHKLAKIKKCEDEQLELEQKVWFEQQYGWS